MEKSDRKNTSLVILTGPLIIYEITFAIFVIYYIQEGITWFKISFLSISISVLIAFFKILSDYRQWNTSGDNKKAYTISQFANLLYFSLYLFCLLVQADQWKVPFSPHLIIIPSLAIPPLIAFIEFLYSDTRKDSGISK